jgi:hypothetical protein
MRSRTRTSKRKAFLLVVVCLLMVMSAMHGRAEEQKPKDEIPEYFFQPDGPFKDPESYERALKAQESDVLSFSDMHIYRSDRHYKICKEDLKEQGHSNPDFLFTRCGMLMQGFADGSQQMLGHVMWKHGDDVIKAKPFCISESMNSIAMATAYVDRYEKNAEDIKHENFNAVMLSALRDKYPCPWLLEFMWKMRNPIASSDNNKNKHE